MKKVLIIEDEKALRDVYSFVLKAEGYNVDTAANGEIGLKKLSSFKPNLIFLDMLMPVMDGIGFLKAANLKRDFPNTKTIIVSNLSDPVDDNKKYGVLKSILKVNLSPRDLAELAKKYT